MRGLIDFGSWQAALSTVLGIAVLTLVAVGIRLLVMQTVQLRRERENRQINERLRTLIAAYRTLGGSFTGELAVDPTHLRELRRRADALAADVGAASADGAPAAPADPEGPASERRRRTRDAVEAALSDVILLGTEAQVRLAVKAAGDMVAGRPIETAELVVSLRDFVREVLDLEPVPRALEIPRQGPLRPAAGGPRGGAARGAAAAAVRGAAGGGHRSAGGTGTGVGIGVGGASSGRGDDGLHDGSAGGSPQGS